MIRPTRCTGFIEKTTIDDIAKHAETARTLSENTVSKGGKARDQMHGRGDFAQSIGKFTETITEISEQTNLLALNATTHLSSNSLELKNNAGNLAGLAEVLQQLIGYFKLQG